MLNRECRHGFGNAKKRQTAQPTATHSIYCLPFCREHSLHLVQRGQRSNDQAYTAVMGNDTQVELHVPGLAMRY